MQSSLEAPYIRRVLNEMHAAAAATDPPLLAAARGKGGAERAALLADAFIPVDESSGLFLYNQARTCATGRVVEFGTSFGLSTIYLAAAQRDRGGAPVITTEMYRSKAERAGGYIAAAGLTEFVDIRVGDALETLKDVTADISLLFLDGMKTLYLPLLQQLEAALLPGATVLADDLDLFPEPLRPYLEYVRSPANGYQSVTVPLGDAMEFSVRC